jgi:hypothetical protein
VARRLNRGWLEPLRLSGTSLPPNVLLMAKLVTLCFLLTQWRSLPRPYLPFVHIFDRLGSPTLVQRVLKVAFLISALLLFWNRWVRASCIVLSAVIGAAVLSSRVYFGNNRVFSACVLLLAGLQQTGQGPWLIRSQVILVYLGAGLNKLLDPDWRSGQFFETWTSAVPHHQRLRSHIPFSPRHLSRLVSWLVIAVELWLVVGFSRKRLHRAAVWTGTLYHTALLVDTGSTFTMFYFAMLSAYLAFVEWPSGPVSVEYDSRLRPLMRAWALWSRLDPDHVIQWRPSPAQHAGVSATTSGHVYQGWSAVTALALRQPANYLAGATLLSLLRPSRHMRWLALAAVGACSPVLQPVGDLALRLVARGPVADNRFPGRAR